MKHQIFFTKQDVAEALAEKFPHHFPKGSATPVNWSEDLCFQVDGNKVCDGMIPVHPREYLAYQSGFDAFGQGKMLSDNPFTPNSRYRQQCWHMWNRGFNYAEMSTNEKRAT